MSPRCLLLSTRTIADVLRGGEKQAVLLAAGLRDRGWDVLLGVPRAGKVRQAAGEAGLPHFAVTVRPEFSPWAFWRLHARARAFRPTVLHLNDPHAVSLGAYARWLRTAPLVIGHRRLAKAPHHVRSYRWGVDGLICISEAARRAMVEAGYPADRTAVVHDCVDARYLETPVTREEARRRIGLGDGDFVLVTATALARGKDHATILRALAALPDRGGLRLLVAGDGPLRPRVERMSSELGLEAEVRFMGSVEGPSLVDAYRAADVFVHATEHEGLGLAALEAQAAGLPVIATRVGGMAEAVEHGRTGLLVDRGDVAGFAKAVERLRADPDFRRCLGQAGPGRIRTRFSPGAMVDGVLAAYARFRPRGAPCV